MSKTKKIRKLRNQLEEANKQIGMKDWMLDNFRQQSYIQPKTFRSEEPPVITSEFVHERREFEQLLRYIYAQMNNEYQMAKDLDPYCDIGKISFVIYMSTEILHMLGSIGNYNEMQRREDGYYFRDWKIVEVIGTEKYHCRFVRVK